MARRKAGGGARRRRGTPRPLATVPSGQRALRALARATADLREVGAPFALVGGLAVSVRAVPRLTRDVDFAVAVQAEGEAEGVVHAMAGLGYSVESLLEHAPTGRLATVRLRSPDGVLIDLLFASSGVEREVVSGAEEMDVLGEANVPVARTGHLLALKVLSRNDRLRPQDYDDLQGLLAIAGAAERRCAEQTLRLISSRGFARRRNLLALWRKALAGRARAGRRPKP